jgi:hypothetical protein
MGVHVKNAAVGMHVNVQMDHPCWSKYWYEASSGAINGLWVRAHAIALIFDVAICTWVAVYHVYIIDSYTTSNGSIKNKSNGVGPNPQAIDCTRQGLIPVL